MAAPGLLNLTHGDPCLTCHLPDSACVCADTLLGPSEWGAHPHEASGTASRVVDDLGAFRVTCAALSDLGCTSSDVSSLFGLLAALLHLGNASFDDDPHGNAKAADGAGEAAVAAAGRALQCDSLGSLLLHRNLNVRHPSLLTTPW